MNIFKWFQKKENRKSNNSSVVAFIEKTMPKVARDKEFMEFTKEFEETEVLQIRNNQIYIKNKGISKDYKETAEIYLICLFERMGKIKFKKCSPHLRG